MSSSQITPKPLQIAAAVMFVLTGTTTGPVSIGVVTVKLWDHALQSAPSLTRTHNMSTPEPLWYVVCGSCDAET